MSKYLTVKCSDIKVDASVCHICLRDVSEVESSLKSEGIHHCSTLHRTALSDKLFNI